MYASPNAGPHRTSKPACDYCRILYGSYCRRADPRPPTAVARATATRDTGYGARPRATATYIDDARFICILCSDYAPRPRAARVQCTRRPLSIGVQSEALTERLASSPHCEHTLQRSARQHTAGARNAPSLAPACAHPRATPRTRDDGHSLTTPRMSVVDSINHDIVIDCND